MLLSRKTTVLAQENGHRVDVWPCAKRVRIRFGDEIVADTHRALLLRESGHTPVYYVPREDARLDLMSPSDHTTRCPYKGEASYWNVTAGRRMAENAVWSYEDPIDGVAAIRGHMAFYWNLMDAWYEEDEEIFVHPRDPFVRIDILESRRPVRVRLGGDVVAETDRALFLFETGLPVRYYIPRADVRMGLLTPTATITQCPYKGTAVYWSVTAGGNMYDDVVWSYPEPLPEVGRIAGHLCFYQDRVDEMTVDGEAVGA